jgi:gamma-glutamyltranspeptidase/glutathione hydrolase
MIHLASTEGLKVLEEGGNAFDAAITVSSILTILLPNTGSAGGDGFLLALDSGGELVAYNGSGRSARYLDVDEYLARKPKRGPLMVTVPGLVDLWEWTNANYGSIELVQLLKRAISLAENGYNLQERLFRSVESGRPILSRYQSWNDVFGSLRSGSHLRFPKLAKIYSAIARRGADAFYRSSLTEDIVEELARYKVPLTYEDFAEYRGEKTEPIKCGYDNYDLYELPPNSQGLSTLQLLRLINLTGLNKMSFENPERLTTYFKLVKEVYEDRDRYVADPNYFEPPVDRILSARYLKERTARISHLPRKLNTNDTTFFVTADKYGNLVGFIQSIFDSFGSGIVAQEIPFQNRGAGFANEPGLPNSPAPRKRPLHTLSVLLAHHDVRGDYMIGCTGGDFRPQIHAEAFMNAADYNMPLSKAVEAPRYMLTLWRGKRMSSLVEEPLWSPHLPNWAGRIEYQSEQTGIVQMARRRLDGVFEFVADLRGGGVAVPFL